MRINRILYLEQDRVDALLEHRELSILETNSLSEFFSVRAPNYLTLSARCLTSNVYFVERNENGVPTLFHLGIHDHFKVTFVHDHELEERMKVKEGYLNDLLEKMLVGKKRVYMWIHHIAFERILRYGD